MSAVVVTVLMWFFQGAVACAAPAVELAEDESAGFHQVLKEKFIEGDASFMSLVALALVLGLAFCIERIIYLSLSEINAKRFMREIDAKIEAGDIEGAKTQCRNTRGPVASICYQGLLRINSPIEDIERSVAAYGTVQAPLNISSRHDVDKFIEQIKCGKSTPLKNITSGYHYHTIEAKSEDILDIIENKLKLLGFLVELPEAH